MLNSIAFETSSTRKVIVEKRLLEKWILKSQINASYQQWEVPTTKIQFSELYWEYDKGTLYAVLY